MVVSFVDIERKVWEVSAKDTLLTGNPNPNSTVAALLTPTPTAL
jgi:hypothetical protein